MFRRSATARTQKRKLKVSQLNSNHSPSSSSDDSLSFTSSSDSSYTSSRSSSQDSDNTLNMSFKGMFLSSKNLTTAASKSIIATTINPEIIIRSKSSEPSTTVDPIIGPMSFFKTERGGINMCMNGFSYQKLKEMKDGIKWWCCGSPNKSIKCPILLYTSYNQGDDDHPQYDFKKVTGDHNHQPDKNKLVIQKFKSDLKQRTQSATL